VVQYGTTETGIQQCSFLKNGQLSLVRKIFQYFHTDKRITFGIKLGLHYLLNLGVIIKTKLRLVWQRAETDQSGSNESKDILEYH